MSIVYEGTLKKKLNKIYRLLPITDTPVMYTKFLMSGPQPPDKSMNPNNLFDDTNKVDRKWLRSALRYLARLG